MYGVLYLTGVSRAAASPNHGCVMEIMTVQMGKMNLLLAVHLISTPVTPHTSNARITSRLSCVEIIVYPKAVIANFMSFCSKHFLVDPPCEGVVSNVILINICDKMCLP